MSSLFKQTTTFDPIYSLLNAESEERRDELTQRWVENKLEELNFVGVVGALIAGVLTSTGSWPSILPNGTRSPWTVRACWYCGLIIALTSVIVAANQTVRLRRLSTHPKHHDCIRRLLSSKSRDRWGKLLPRRMQVYAWQLSAWLLVGSVIAMLAGMFILIWSSTLTDSQQLFQDWWNGEAMLAVTFTIIAVVLGIVFFLQQYTLYSWHGADDQDQRNEE